ncbi:hypothetical protein COY59_04525, partial [Candidatus Gottesmanbacteria bacterium CG_4_10_14_0_8_um_filter_37_24]
MNRKSSKNPFPEAEIISSNVRTPSNYSLPPSPPVLTARRNYKKTIFLFTLCFLILIVSGVSLFIYLDSQNNIKPGIRNPNGDKGTILFIYSLTFFDRSGQELLDKISSQIIKENWRLEVLPIDKKLTNTTPYDAINAYIPSLWGNENKDFEKRIQEIKNATDIPVVLFVKGNNSEKNKEIYSHILSENKSQIIAVDNLGNNDSDIDLISKDINLLLKATEEHDKQNDKLRIDQFQRLSNNIYDYFLNQQKLPVTLSDPVLDPERIKDPITKQSIEYHSRSKQFYRFCTRFDWNFAKYPDPIKYEDYTHLKGHDCYYFNAQNRFNLIQKEEILDQIRLKDFIDLSNIVKGYFQTKSELPVDLQSLSNNLNGTEINDPETNEIYRYKRISETDFEFCTTFSSDSPATASLKDIADIYNKNIHKQGYNCKRFIISDYKGFRINEILKNTSFGNWADYTDHVEVDEWKTSDGRIKRIDRISTEPTTGYPSYYAVQLTPGPYSFLTSSKVKVIGGKFYDV